MAAANGAQTDKRVHGLSWGEHGLAGICVCDGARQIGRERDGESERGRDREGKKGTESECERDGEGQHLFSGRQAET